MIIVDVETTGINAWKNSIVSIGAVDFENPSRTFNEECKVWDGAEIHPKALEVNGFTKDELLYSGKQTVRETVIKFIDWLKPIEDKTVAGHNPTFDLDFLNVAAKKSGLKLPVGRRSVDLHSVCFAHIKSRGLTPPLYWGGSNLSTSVVNKYVGLPDEPKPHIAINGAKIKAEAFSRLIKGKGLLNEFEQYEIPDYLKKID